MNFSETITHWYTQNKRDLPWRNTTDAYLIWLSEIILQQTRVEQGMPYFYRFAEHYPTVSHFAQASEDEILRLWQGLGYYSRGRNMLKTAKLVHERFDGVFPEDYDQLISLKGIGEYTAAAISSFAANQAKAVVDGNVNRVIARYFGIDEPINSTAGKKLFQQTANDLLNTANPALHNQAIMEFGALQCKPKNPDCGICPLQQSCFAVNNNAVAGLPVKLKKLSIKSRYLNYFLITDGDTVLMNKRGDKDIWANMYDLPLLETDMAYPSEQLLQLPAVTELLGATPVLVKAYPFKKHVLTHQHIYANFYHVSVNVGKLGLKPSWTFFEREKIKKLALPKLIFLFLTNFLEL